MTRAATIPSGVFADGLLRRIGFAAAALAVSGMLAVAPATARAVSIEIGSARARPGEQVAVSVVLRTMGAEIAGVQVEFAFDPSTPVALTRNGRPACRSLCGSDYQLPDLAARLEQTDDPVGHAGKGCAGSNNAAFLPIGCDPAADCTGVRLLELSLNTVEPLPDGGHLFLCTMNVAPDAPIGTHPLVCANPGAADPNGEAMAATCADGAIAVVCEGDCDADGEVAVSELVTGIRIAQGSLPLDACPAVDADDSATVTIDELVKSRINLLDGCRTPSP